MIKFSNAALSTYLLDFDLDHNSDTIALRLLIDNDDDPVDFWVHRFKSFDKDALAIPALNYVSFINDDESFSCPDPLNDECFMCIIEAFASTDELMRKGTPEDLLALRLYFPKDAPSDGLINTDSVVRHSF